MRGLIEQKKLVICVGAGGVGKTSLSASIALQAALLGRKVLVLTIDPAKRLANSLGLEEFGNTETKIDLSRISETKGELWAMMLDGQKTFDELIKSLTNDEETQQRILNNNIYQGITDTIVGNQEYMATEKLFDVVSSKRYDLIVLDTPPVKNALDFLDSPGKMARFVDKRIMKWFLASKTKKKGLLNLLLTGTSAALFRLLGYIFGTDFLEDIAVFFINFRDLYEGFQERHSAVEKIFRDSDTCFLIVSAPNESALEVAGFFLDELARRNMNTPALIVNQCHIAQYEHLNPNALLEEKLESFSDGLQKHTVSTLLARMKTAHKRLYNLAKEEHRLLNILKQKIQKHQKIYHIPRFHGEVHDMQALKKVGDVLINQGEKS